MAVHKWPSTKKRDAGSVNVLNSIVVLPRAPSATSIGGAICSIRNSTCSTIVRCTTCTSLEILNKLSNVNNSGSSGPTTSEIDSKASNRFLFSEFFLNKTNWIYINTTSTDKRNTTFGIVVRLWCPKRQGHAKKKAEKNPKEEKKEKKRVKDKTKNKQSKVKLAKSKKKKTNIQTVHK
ncbi:hypothetical protein RFI_35341 [Reticulomyxa filosa]|uniref:Uncharacterized protein n=1 Tax=Reticulomyxa filosa TaxID=46433 RepID=X6LKE7_RETFI|nr:hypothetical protein RFI_35341 [Reticulomyxa filosa]|eukprot:ETO02094.1 hypothetical protein RFI_35341 [Reticulomyxa filosa]